MHVLGVRLSMRRKTTHWALVNDIITVFMGLGGVKKRGGSVTGPVKGRARSALGWCRGKGEESSDNAISIGLGV